jgi:hypothetical protein
MMQKIIGSQKVYSQLVEQVPVELAALQHLSNVSSSGLHDGVLTCDEVYDPFADLTTPQPHRGEYRHYIHLHKDTVSLTVWEVMHLAVWIAQQALWYGAYFYTVTQKVEHIHELRVYELRELDEHDFTYITFEGLDTPTVRVYKRVHVHAEMVPAPFYSFRDATLERLEPALKRVARVELMREE